jgi:hypothetical protein
MVEEAAGDIDTNDYPNFESWMLYVFDSSLNRLNDESYSNESEYLDKYSSVLSELQDTFGEQLKDFYESEQQEMISENFDRILDLYQKVKKGEELRPSEQTMMRSFKKFVDKGGNAEDFEYNDGEDYDVDEREGERFRWERYGTPLTYEFSEEYESDEEINYFGEIKYMGDEFLGVISTDKRGYLTDYDFYSVFDEEVRLQDILKENGLEPEITNFFQEEIINSLRK